LPDMQILAMFVSGVWGSGKMPTIIYVDRAAPYLASINPVKDEIRILAGYALTVITLDAPNPGFIRPYNMRCPPRCTTLVDCITQRRGNWQYAIDLLIELRNIDVEYRGLSYLLCTGVHTRLDNTLNLTPHNAILLDDLIQTMYAIDRPFTMICRIDGIWCKKTTTMTEFAHLYIMPVMRIESRVNDTIILTTTPKWHRKPYTFKESKIREESREFDQTIIDNITHYDNIWIISFHNSLTIVDPEPRHIALMTPLLTDEQIILYSFDPSGEDAITYDDSIVDDERTDDTEYHEPVVLDEKLYAEMADYDLGEY
jgi:hypothetical protein